ncbi:MAG: GNAT family N-acetyltransferase [Paenibacillaceae bacterium]|nr:GNAT family N-acetyltransferase [Paenibacillaceae bacterium]
MTLKLTTFSIKVRCLVLVPLISTRIRGRFRQIIKLKPIDQSNWYACTQLEVTDEQRQVYPVSTVYWLAESAYCGYSPLAVYVDEQLVGFAVYAVDPDDGSYWIMAFMIDHKFQRKGYGRSGMEELIGYIKEKHSCNKIVLGHRPENKRASDLYASLGFAEVARGDEREVIRELIMP